MFTSYSLKYLRVLTKVLTSYLLCWVRRNHFLLLLSKSPNGAILLHSPGRKPWVNRSPHLLSPVGAAQPQRKANTRAVSAAPTELILHLVRVSPRFHIGLCPHFTLGYAGVSPLQGLFVGISNPKALDSTTLALGLLASFPYNGVIQTATTNWRIVLKLAILHPNTDIISWKSKKKAHWIDFWIYEGKNKKRIRLLWT